MTDLASIAHQALRDVPHARCSFLQLNRASDAEGSKLVCLVFVDGASTPSVVMRIAPGSEGQDAFGTEFSNLQLLALHGSSLVRAAVPRPLFLGDLHGLRVMVESAVGGQSMKFGDEAAYYGSPAAARHIHAVTALHAELHRVFGTVDLASRSLAAQLADSLAEFRERYSRSAALDRQLAEAEDHLGGLSIPASPWHGDFCTANVLIAKDDEVRVIDWEYPLTKSFPLADLFHFVASLWSVPVGPGIAQRARNFRRIFFTEDLRGHSWRSAILGYGRSLGVETKSLHSLAMAAWVLYANRKHRDLHQPGRKAPAPGDVARHFPMVMVEEAHCLNLELLAELRDNFVLAKENQLA